jgi:hypothetical protein
MRVTVAIRHVNIMRLYGMFIDVADGPYAFVVSSSQQVSHLLDLTDFHLLLQAYMYEAYVLLDRYTRLYESV